jgi:hypothetical protein
LIDHVAYRREMRREHGLAIARALAVGVDLWHNACMT